MKSKNSLKLIRACDANYMNQAVYNKFARTWAEREGVRTNADDVLKECRDKIQNLYYEVAAYFGMPGQQYVTSQLMNEDYGNKYNFDKEVSQE